MFQTAYAFETERQATVRLEREAIRSGKIWNGEEIRRSFRLFKETAANWKELGETENSAACLREAAKLALILSDHQNTRTALERSLQFDLETKNTAGRVYTHGLLAIYFERTGNIPESENQYRQALYLSEKMPPHARAFANLVAGEIEFLKVELNTAKIYFEEAQKYAEQTADHDLKAEILFYLASINSAQGEIDKGLNRFREARRLWETTGNQRWLAILHNGLGLIHLHTGDKLSALENFRKAEAMFPENVDYIQKGISLSGSGALYFHYGRLDLAETYFLKALASHKQAAYLNGQLAVFPSLIKISHLNGKTATAKDLIEEAFELNKRLKHDFFLANIKEEQAIINYSEGKYDEAIENFKEIWPVSEAAGLNLTRILNSLGRIYERKEDFDTARQYYERAEKINRRIKDDLELSENLYNLARLCLRDKRPEDALKKSEESISLSERLYQDVGSDNLRGKFLSTVFERYELYIVLLMEMHRRFPAKDFEIKALQAAENFRSRLMLENLQFTEADFTADADPQLIKQETDLSRVLISKKEELSDLLNQNPESPEISALETQIAETDNDLKFIIAKLRRDSPIYASVKNGTEFDYRNFQKNILDDNTLLLEFFIGREKSFLWLLGKKEVRVFELPGGRILNEKIDRLLTLLLPDRAEPTDDIRRIQKTRLENENRYRLESKELSRILFGQIGGLIENQRLIIVPDGKLRLLPVDALPFPDEAEYKPLLITNEIVYQPSAQMLHLLKTKKTAERPGRDFLVYTDPVFSTDDERLSPLVTSNPAHTGVNPKPGLSKRNPTNTTYLERLSGSAAETDAIFEIFNRKNSKIVEGFAARRELFLTEDFADYKILHLATHGIFNETFPEQSGVVLSQYDERGKPRNGLIWLQDIYRLKLRADLVVLSACDTGIGEELKGEGLLSLSNGFLQVGARSVIASHWKVDDEATVKLMNHFYRILADEKVTTTEALRKARIKMFEDPNYRSAYYWASFTAHGDFEVRPQPSLNFDYRRYFYLLLSIFAVFTLYFLVKLSDRKSI